nr:MAG TPA: hypothetical protein [Caudoviricetes sp.]
MIAAKFQSRADSFVPRESRQFALMSWKLVFHIGK